MCVFIILIIAMIFTGLYVSEHQILLFKYVKFIIYINKAI